MDISFDPYSACQWFRSSAFRSRGDRFSILFSAISVVQVLSIQITCRSILDPFFSNISGSGPQHSDHVEIDSRSFFQQYQWSSAFRSRGDRFSIRIQQYQWYRYSTSRSPQ